MAAPSGGGGGGPVGFSGGSFTGAAQSFEYYGNLVGAYSGIIPVDNTETTMIDALSGSHTIKAKLYFSTGSRSSRDMGWTVLLNGIEVYQYVSAGTTAAGANPQNHMQIIIPPYTQFKITSINREDANSENQSVVLVGKVHR